MGSYRPEIENKKIDHISKRIITDIEANNLFEVSSVDSRSIRLKSLIIFLMN